MISWALHHSLLHSVCMHSRMKQCLWVCMTVGLSVVKNIASSRIAKVFTDFTSNQHNVISYLIWVEAVLFAILLLAPPISELHISFPILDWHISNLLCRVPSTKAQREGEAFCECALFLMHHSLDLRMVCSSWYWYSIQLLQLHGYWILVHHPPKNLQSLVISSNP